MDRARRRFYRSASEGVDELHIGEAGAAACGAPLADRRGRKKVPTPDEDVCEDCARLTAFTRRRRVAKAWVRVRLPKRDLRAVQRAGLDVDRVLRRAWQRELGRLRPLPRAPMPRDAVICVTDAALELLPRWGGRGVPGGELVRATGLTRREVHAVMGGAPRTMRLGSAGVQRAYSRERIEAARAGDAEAEAEG